VVEAVSTRESRSRSPLLKPARHSGVKGTVGALNTDALLVVNMFIVRHLVRLYDAFDGDLTAAIVLGEVAHHNLSAYLARATSARRTAAGDTEHVPDRSDYLPTNAFSIAQVTGIPRQTVRRKVKALVARGWLLEEKGGLIVSPVPFEHFRTSNEALAADVMDTLNTVVRLTRGQGRG
jgi:hypothetical protein